jgi:undecaprenyl-diphosphatase
MGSHFISMTNIDAIILGIIQGLTEFLPVSSSGHLVLAESLFGVKMPGVTFEVLIHIATLLSVLIYFHKKIFRLVQSLFVKAMVNERKIILFLIIGTIPAGLAGILLKDFFEKTFSNPTEASIELIINGGILLIPYFLTVKIKGLSLFSVIMIGIGQAIAILPGISRSGSTIVAGIMCGVKPEDAAEFSFLLSIPAIGGAAVLKMKDMFSTPATLSGPYLVAFLTSFLFGLLSVYVVLETVKKGKLKYFAYYCFAIGAVGLYHFL